VYHNGAARGATIEVAVRSLCLLILVAAAAPAQVVYELAGRISPEGRASVTLFGATHPFTASTFTDDSGRFTFKKLAPATYTVAVYQPGRGEARQTIEVGPSLADSRNRIQLTVALRDADFDPTIDRRRHSVTVRQLAIPERALRDYLDAQHRLSDAPLPAGRAAFPPGAEAGPNGVRGAGQSGWRAGHPAQAG
jgi:hypothetical protein